MYFLNTFAVQHMVRSASTVGDLYYMGRQRDIAPSISKGLILYALARALCSFDDPTPALTRMGRLPRVWAVSPFLRALPAISARRFMAPLTTYGQSAGIFAGHDQYLSTAGQDWASTRLSLLSKETRQGCCLYGRASL